MSILFVAANHNPFDSCKSGTIQRTHLLLEACASCSHVDVAVFREGAESDIPNCSVVLSQDISMSYAVSERKQKLKRVLMARNIEEYYPAVRSAAEKLDELIASKHYDYIVIRYLSCAVQAGLLKYADRLIVDVDDSPVDEERWLSRNTTSIRARWYHWLLAIHLQGMVKRTLSHICFSFFSNPEQVQNKKSTYLPNIPYSINKETDSIINRSHQLLFVGDFRYEPNSQGAEHFVHAIFPIVKRHYSDVKFLLVGKPKNEAWKNEMEAVDGVIVKGFVKDLNEEYHNTEVCVAPIYLGAGTNIKVLEALGMQRTCVASVFAMRGFTDTLKAGEDILVANTDDEFAQHVVSVLSDSEYNQRIALQGYKKILKFYSWPAFRDVVVDVLNQLNMEKA